MDERQGSQQGVPRMTKKGFHKGNTGELNPAARAFLEAYQAACVKTDEDFRRVVSGNGGYRRFEGGLVELTDELSRASDDLVDKAIKLFGPRGASERSLSLLAEQVGQGLVSGEYGIEDGIAKLIGIFVDEGNSSFEVLLPNYLVRFKDGVRALEWIFWPDGKDSRCESGAKMTKRSRRPLLSRL
jgi:hypothetical protein